MSSSFENEALSGLAPEHAAELTGRGARLELVLGKRLAEPGEALEWVYFPEGALVSLVISTEDGRTAESGMVGREGVVGLVEACGSGVATTTCVVQSAGPAWRVPAAACRSLAEAAPSFRALLMRQLEFQMIESRYSATCRSFHPVEQRLARWLLECQDRGDGSDILATTQEYMASMLGVQRTTVNAFAKLLQDRGLIHYSRGKVRLIDVEGLERLACECRGVLVRERERLTES
jgi:CRP-like cAMP-binding protein